MTEVSTVTSNDGPKCSTPTDGPWALALAGTVVAKESTETPSAPTSALPPVGCSHFATYQQVVLEGQ